MQSLGSFGVDDPNEIEMTDELLRWRARDLNFIRGPWSKLRATIPEYELETFSVGVDGPTNPYLRSVIRLPVNPTEHRIPIATVSPTYALAPHNTVADMCIEGLQACGVDVTTLKFELGLSVLGEWMNFRVLLPEKYSLTDARGYKTGLRLECFNSVDGSSRLMILLGWLRFVCSNGLVIGETKAELRDIHNAYLDLEAIPGIIARGMAQVKSEISRLQRWENEPLNPPVFRAWVNGKLASTWGKKAACRVFHICEEGIDVEITDPFAPGPPTEKPTKAILDVPGAAKPSRNLYDVSQALSWVSTKRTNTEERIEWQGQIPDLIDSLIGEMPSQLRQLSLIEK